MDYLSLVKSLIAEKEGPCLEFKVNNQDPDMIGKDISALSNSALLEGMEGSFMIWGVDDKTHSIVGTDFYPYLAKKGGENLINWLTGNLANVEFFFKEILVDSKHVVILVVCPATFYAATFQNNVYVREGSYTKPALKLPEVQKKLWALLDTRNHEMVSVSSDLTPDQILSKLDTESFLSKTKQKHPSNIDAMMDLLIKYKLIHKQADHNYSITLMGALLFSKDLTEYDLLMNKTIRIVKYIGKGKSEIQRQLECKKGYAVQFEELINYVSILLPSHEKIVDGIMTSINSYPPEAVREIIVNAMMHQDLTDIRRNITIEIFDDRIVVTNPGKLMVDKLRIVDWMPEPRNRHIAVLMRSMKMCESIGSGWDRIVQTCETMCLPAPSLESENTFTRVTLFSNKPFSEMSRQEKVWATYMHACSKHQNGESISNSSLRERFGLDSESVTAISRVLVWACDDGLIKQHEESSSKRSRTYIPFWA